MRDATKLFAALRLQKASLTNKYSFLCPLVNKLEQIKAPIDAELKHFESRFREDMKSAVPLLDTVMTYIVKRKGKQIRPMFVFIAPGFLMV